MICKNQENQRWCPTGHWLKYNDLTQKSFALLLQIMYIYINCLHNTINKEFYFSTEGDILSLCKFC